MYLIYSTKFKLHIEYYVGSFTPPVLMIEMREQSTVSSLMLET